MGFWDYFAPAAGALVGGGLGSGFGEAGRVIGAGLGGAAGSAAAGGDLEDIALAGGLSGLGSWALPYGAEVLGIDTTNIPFLDSSFGLPGSGGATPTPLSSFSGGADSLAGGAGDDWINPDWAETAGSLRPGEYESINPITGQITLESGMRPDQLSTITSDLGLAPIDAAQAERAMAMTNAEALGLGNVGDVINGSPQMGGIENYGGTFETGLYKPALAAATTQAAESGPGFLDSALAGVKKQFGENPIGLGLAGLGLGYNLIKAGQETPEAALLRKRAEEQSESGRIMQQYIQTGQLPPGMHASIDQAKNAAKARIRSQYASNNLSGSSMERDALNNVDAQFAAQAGTAAIALLNSGVQQSGMSDSLYRYLAQSQDRKDEAIGQALANFAGASVPTRRAA